MIKTKFENNISLFNEEHVSRGNLKIEFSGEITPEETVRIRQDIESVLGYFREKYSKAEPTSSDNFVNYVTEFLRGKFN